MCIRDSRETVQPYVMARIVDFAAFIMSYNFAEASSGDAITFRIDVYKRQHPSYVIIAAVS